MLNHFFRYVPIVILLCSVSASAEIITLKNGDSIHVVVKDETNSQLTVEHQSLGTLSILREQIVSINHKLEILPEDMETATTTADKGMFGTGLLKDWERSLGISLVGSDGTSENYTSRSSLNFKYEDDKSRWESVSIYILSSDENETSENKAYTTLTKDWLLLDSKYFYFSYTNFHWDEFKDYDYRVTQFGGTGYQFIKNEKWEALCRLGLGVKRTIGDELNNDTTVEGLLGFEITRDIKNKHTIEGTNIFFPSLTDKDEYRNVSTLNWNIKFDYLSGLGLKIGLRNEYDSTQRNIPKYDFDYYVSLTWDF
jgi:putative salt-induced outer membrane protein YdiY